MTDHTEEVTAMKNHKLLRMLSLCLALMMLWAAAMPVSAESNAKPKIITGGIQWVGMGKGPVIISDLPDGAEIMSIKSSKPGVLKVGKGGGIGPHDLWKEPLKAGKSKVTVKYKVNGKPKSVSATFTVKVYPDPFEYIKLNSKKIDLKKNIAVLIVQNYDKNKVTIKFKLKSGWKLSQKCSGYRIKGDEWLDVTWENGKAISLKGYDAADLYIDVVNKKTGQTCNFEFAISR